jgi:hypothetical protein
MVSLQANFGIVHCNTEQCYVLVITVPVLDETCSECSNSFKTSLHRQSRPERSTTYHIKYLLLFSSSGSIVSNYGRDDRAIEVRSPTGAEDFSSSPCVQTGSGAHPASYPMGTGGSFPAGKARPRRDADHSPPSSAEVKNE